MIIVELHGLAHFAPSNHFIRGVMTGLEEVIPWGGGGHDARLHFKMPCVCVYKCFTSLSEIKRKFFVFVGVLEKGDSDAL